MGTAPPLKSSDAASIIDAHVNVASWRYIPRRFIEDQAANVYARFQMAGEKITRARIQDRVFQIYEDHLADALVMEMDAAGISEAVLLAPNFAHSTQCALTAEEVVLAHREIVERHPGRFHVFFGADPRSGTEGIDLFERSVNTFGFEGLKLYPPCGYSPSDPRLFPYFEICAAKGLPVLTHTGPGWQALDFELGHPLLVDGASRSFPTVNFILGHGAVTYVEECSYLCMYRSNVYLDVSGIASAISPNGWVSHLNQVLRTGINHKVVFGTSWPAFKLSMSLRKMLENFRSDAAVFTGVKRAEIRMVMGGNMRRLLSRGCARAEIAA